MRRPFVPLGLALLPCACEGAGAPTEPTVEDRIAEEQEANERVAGD